jgi:glucose/arabinose dehydrogenase
MASVRRYIAGAVVCVCALSGAAAARAVTLPPDFQESVALEGLNLPTAASFAADGRVFVAEKSGRIVVFSDLDDATPTVFADLSTNVYSFWDRGLLGLALDPDFPAKPYVYVSYTHDAVVGGQAPLWGTPTVFSDPCPTPPGSTDDGCLVSGRVSRLEAAGDLMIGSERVLVEDWCQQFPSHSVGDLEFGADGALYASGGEGANFFVDDYGQLGGEFDGDLPNPCGDPPSGAGGTQTPPTAEGGSLRSQDIRTRGDPTGLSGTVIRIDPETGAALPDNPLSLDPEPNARRIVAYGLRNPFRMAIRPGTSDVWLGDVGSGIAEEVNRIELPAGQPVENFGWPCFEGGGHHGGWDSLDLDLCEDLYDGGGSVSPVYDYLHWEEVVPGDGCGNGPSSSLSGLAFYEGGDYPGYDGALFFSDYSRNCIWVMRAGVDGIPDPGTVQAFAFAAAGPVDLQLGPGGDLFYVDFDGGKVRRIEYVGENAAPIARIEASTTAGEAPLTVDFGGTGSTDADGDALAYAWDLDGDGSFDDSIEADPTWTFADRGTYTVRLKVTDPLGATGRASLVVHASNSVPVPSIDGPAAGTTWSAGKTIAFTGSAQDHEDGVLPASGLHWTLRLHHCPESDCHVHVIQQFDGVASGSFVAPDHSYPSHLELELKARDADGAVGTTLLELDPDTVTLTFATNPSGLLLVAAADQPAPAPFTRTMIVGATTTVTAPSPQVFAGTTFLFSSWSNGGARSHELVAPERPTTYTATFAGPVIPPPPPQVTPPPAAPPPPPVSPPPLQPRPPAVRCTVPKVVGKSLEAARRALVAARCAPGRISRTYSRKVRAGLVVAQSPRPRTRLPRGGKVRLVVSRGRKR